MALIGTEKGSIHQWSVLDHSEVGRPFVGHKSAISHIDLSPDGSQYVSSGGFSDQVFVRNVRNGSILRVIQPTATSSFHSAIFTRDGRSVAMGYDDSDSARIVDLATGSIREYRGTLLPAFHAEFSQNDNEYLLTGTYDAAHLWDLQTGEETKRFASTSDANAIALLPDSSGV